MLTNLIRRNRDFMAAVSREMTAAGASGVSIDEIIGRAISSGAPAYYVTLDTAAKNCQRIRSGMEPSKPMWREFYAKVSRRMEQTGCTLPTAVIHVMDSEGASGFFISPCRGREIYNEMKRLKKMTR